MTVTTWRRFLPLLALLTALLALATMVIVPKWPLQQAVYQYIFVLDITQSMNARDYHQSDMPNDRLSFAKRSLQHILPELPCGSEVGLGVFSTQNMLLLFEPLEVCEHFSSIDDVLAHIDWRMAWAGDSNIDRGLYGSIRALKKANPDAHLVFMTDGEQTVTERRPPPLSAQAGKITGLVLGVGQTTPVVIPKLDPDNRVTGYWKNREVHSPHGQQADPAANYLSSLNEPHLRQLAHTAQLGYRHLASVSQLEAALINAEFAELRTVDTDIRWVFAIVALFSILLLYRPR